MKRAIGCVVLLSLLALPGTVNASIISGTVSTPAGGSFVQLTPGGFFPSTPANTVGNNNFQNNNTLFGFNEDQNIVLGAPLAVDTPAGFLPAGTTVASHYIFFDPISGRLVGTVTFDSPILAIITSTGTLLASDFLANTGVNYLNPGARGLEPGDFASFAGNTLFVDFTASSPGDYIRVLTEFSPAAVPEPSTILLFGTVLTLGAGFVARRRRTAA